MIGWLLNSVAGPDFAPYWARVETLKIKADLLTAAIAQKRRKKIEVMDLFTKGPLDFKAGSGLMTHPGPDGRYQTRDDIVLKSLGNPAKTHN